MPYFLFIYLFLLKMFPSNGEQTTVAQAKAQAKSNFVPRAFSWERGWAKKGKKEKHWKDEESYSLLCTTVLYVAHEDGMKRDKIWYQKVKI